jgi:peptide/nickel transport system substrate-binding protein
MRSAGYPSGRYTGTKPLTIFASQSGGDRLLAETLVTQLHKLGFPVKAHFASPSVVYQFCGNPRAEIAVCPNDFWIKDFYDGQAMLDPTFNGRVINSTNNSNVSQLDDPKVNAAMTRAETLPAGEARNREWGRVDKLITGDAAALPWLWPTLNLFESRDVSGVANEWAGSWDLSYTSLR